MAKTKADWVKEAKDLGLKVSEKDKIADIKVAIDDINPKKHDKSHPAKTLDTSGEPKEVAKKGPAKAGKRSTKAMREDNEEESRQERIETERESKDEPEEQVEKKGPVPVPRPLIERRSKRYQEVAKLVDSEKLYSLNEAVDLSLKTSNVKFDPSLELHIRLNVDPKQADQNVRGVVVLPHGTGKTVRVAVFAVSEDHAKAKEAGADIVGEEEFLELLKKEQINFDVLVSTPQMMAQLGRFAKMLGPKGLMPNPKSGTVTKDIVTTVKQIKAGQLEYRVDDQGIIHTVFGKLSFGSSKLEDNAKVLLSSIKQSKPASVKGAYVEKIYMASTMGPSMTLDSSATLADL